MGLGFISFTVWWFEPADLERQDMERTWKPTTAGILCIIAGIIGLIPGIVVVMADSSIGMLGAPSIVLGIVAIVGGICALGRRSWGPALAGSICALFGPAGFLVIFGFLAVKYADMVPGLQPPPDNRRLLFIFVHRFQRWFCDSWNTRHYIRHHGEARI
ncbi:MAG: hypothetical protein MUO61_04730 [Dehalococcoidia bacterium]|nr:hypothetical protein [Dehalococcoidia bacterium]